MTENIQAPRDDLIRGVFEIRADDDDGNTMVGYPIVFNTFTTIDSWEGKFRERIHPGAVRKTLKERGDQVKVQFDHGMHPVIGSLPLGKPRMMRADDLGLWTETPLSQAQDVQTLIKPRLQEGSIDGMSFRFSVVREEWQEGDDEEGRLPERTILELRLMEFGPVTWPAYEATTVGIRGQAAFAAWMGQSPQERMQVMTQFGHDLRRNIIRVEAGEVVIDRAAPDPEEVEGVEDTEVRDSEDAAKDGTSDDERSQDAAADGTSEDTPAEGHLSPDETDPAAAEAKRAQKLMDRLNAAIKSQEKNNAKAHRGREI